MNARIDPRAADRERLTAWAFLLGLFASAVQVSLFFFPVSITLVFPWLSADFPVEMIPGVLAGGALGYIHWRTDAKWVRRGGVEYTPAFPFAIGAVMALLLSTVFLPVPPDFLQASLTRVVSSTAFSYFTFRLAEILVKKK